MIQLSTEDLKAQFAEVKSEWEYEHEGREFPLIIDITERELSSTEFDEYLAEIEVSTHLSEWA